MKKWLSFILVLVLALVLVGCGEEKENPDNPDTPQTETIKPTSIEISGQKEEIEIGEEFTITVKVLPDNATNKNVRYSSSSSAIATVKDGKVTGISAGTATITVTASGDTKVTKSFDVKVNGSEGDTPIEEIIPPTAIEINGKEEVQVGKVEVLTITYTPEDATKGVTWTSSDESVAKVTNGNVIGLKEGKAIITATSTANPSLSISIEMTVIPAQEEIIEVITPTAITVTVNAEEVEVGYKLTARATVEPNGADQNVRWESTKPEVATIDETGRITGISEGTAYIIAYTLDGSIKSSRVKIKVTPAAPPEVYPDLKGYKIVMMNASSALSDLDPFLDAYAGSDKVFKQQAWNEIESDYNCEISVEAYPDEAPWGKSRYQWINTQAELGDARADFYVISSAWMSDIAGVGSAYNAASVYQRYGKNQMSLSLKQSATYRGGLYALSTGPDEAQNYAKYGLYYNVAWVEKLKVESPAKLFNEGKWTYSVFVDWANSVQALIGEDEYALAGNAYYYWMGMVHSCGIKIADPASVIVTLKNPREIAAAELMRGLYATGAYSSQNSWMESSGLFIDGKAVMTSGDWWFMKSDNRWTIKMWGEDTRYGYVPFPRPDDMPKDAQRVAETGTSLLLFASARDAAHPAGVTYDDVYRAMLDLYLRTNKYYSNDPSYDPESIKRNGIASKVDDPESVEAAMYWDNSKVFYDAVQDFFESPSGCPLAGGNGISNVIFRGVDYQTFIDAMETPYVLLFTSKYSVS